MVAQLKRTQATSSSVQVADSQTIITSLHQPCVASSSADPSKPIAILVSHGMGQQVPFATLAAVAELLQSREDFSTAKPVVRHVRFIDAESKRETWMPCAELELVSPNGELTRKVHLYETYWAPLTEGTISLTEVIRFMATAGFRGLFFGTKRFLRGKSGANRFHRWMFGSSQQFDIPRRTSFKLLCLLLLVLSLVAINSILTLVAGANLLKFVPAAATSARLVTYLTLDLSVLLFFLLPTGLCLWYSMRLSERLGSLSRKLNRKSQSYLKHLQDRRARVNQLAWWLLLFSSASLVVGAVVIAIHYFSLKQAGSATMAGLEWSKILPIPMGLRVRTWIIGFVWVPVIGISWVLRGFLVQYMGDVAIYIDSYKVDKFHKVRDEIKRQAYQTACAIYGARISDADPTVFAYDRILMIGHSLGSVVAYDSLNATLHLDESVGGQLHVADRTGGLITFGSPLDKTAYLFHTQAALDSIRPPLVASVQPLLRNIKVRRAIKWINIYSQSDPISGHLGFYDLPGQQSEENKDWRVINLLDLDSSTPVIAHTQYWNNKLLADTIRTQIFTNLPKTEVVE